MLKNGSKGNQVKNLQDDIIELGFGDLLGKWGADSHFGDATEKSVKAVQKWLGIKVDGIAGPQTEGAINKRKSEAGTKGTRNFNISEFRSKDNGSMLSGGMNDQLLLKLERLRYECGNKPMIINSGYRTKSHNKAVGGASNSQHLYGRAADIKVKDVNASTVYKKADKIFYNGGVGKYSTFVHTDCRGYKARWKG